MLLKNIIQLSITIPSRYSKYKLKIQSFLAPKKDLILRFGLVIGNGVLFLKMHPFIKKYPIEQYLILENKKLQYLGINDVSNLCLRSIENFNVGNYVIINNFRLSIKNIL
jgi:hypothetical protein